MFFVRAPQGGLAQQVQAAGFPAVTAIGSKPGCRSHDLSF